MTRHFTSSAIRMLTARSGVIAALLLIVAASSAAARRPSTIALAGSLSAEALNEVTAAELERLPQTDITTHDPYLEQRVTYRGVLLEDLVSAYGTDATRILLLKAIDEYQTEFCRQEWTDRPILLALRINGRLLTLRDKGPAKVVMPMAEGESRHYTPKWIWMVNYIEFLD